MKIRPQQSGRSTYPDRRKRGPRWPQPISIPQQTTSANNDPEDIQVPVGKVAGLYAELEARACQAGMGLRDYGLIVVLAGLGKKVQINSEVVLGASGSSSTEQQI